MNDPQNESFQGFKDSFAYGSRTDLNFKFLKALSSDEAAEFFADRKSQSAKEVIPFRSLCFQRYLVICMGKLSLPCNP